MNIQQALDRIDTIKPNMVPPDIKVQWLSELDAMIRQEIIDTHYEQKGKPFPHAVSCWRGDPLEQGYHCHPEKEPV